VFDSDDRTSETTCPITALIVHWLDSGQDGCAIHQAVELGVGDFQDVFEVEILVGGEFSGGVLLWKNRQAPLSAKLPIHKHEHLHWNCLLVKTLAFEPTTRRKFLRSTGDAVIFQFDDNEVFVARLVANNVSGSKIGAQCPHLYDGADYQ
jgi:hypothetical protein